MRLLALFLASGALLLLAAGVARLGGRLLFLRRRYRLRQQWLRPERAGEEDVDIIGRPGDSLVARLSARSGRLRRMGMTMEACGLPQALPLLMLSLLCCLALGGLMAMGVAPAPALVVAAGGAWIAANAAVALLARRHRRLFERNMPEALGLFVRGLRAGLPVAECIHAIGREAAAPVGPAFLRAFQQMTLGAGPEQALAAQTRLLDIRAVDFLVTAIAVQRETGGNLSATLDRLQAIVRERERMALKVRALSSEARASAVIIGALPILVGIVMQQAAPDYFAPMLITSAGRLMLGVAAALLVSGAWIMAGIIRASIA